MKQKLLTLLFAAALIAAMTTAAFADTGLAARQVETVIPQYHVHPIQKTGV